MIPQRLIAIMEELYRERYTGKTTLNWKDGRPIEIEKSTKERLPQE